MPQSALTRCRSFVSSHLHTRHPPASRRPPSITLSREMGAGGQTVARLVCERLQARGGHGGATWTTFDKNLVQQILDDHDLPDQLAAFMREEAEPAVSTFLEEVFGVRPSSWQVFELTSNTLIKLAHMGNCVLVGRGGNFVTAHMPRVLHVRLVASTDVRVERVQRRDGLSFEAARDLVRKSDRGRQRYVSSHFDRDIADPSGYQLVLNTERLSPAASAAIIVAALDALLAAP